MSDSRELSKSEKQWLLAISRGPIRKAAAELSMPVTIIDRLISQRLLRWEAGFLAITAKGESAVALLRSMRE
jgi:hypothetical protein